jgi:hypothetical protein
MLHSNSGAGRQKGDGHDDEQVIEIKDGGKSYRMTLDDVRTIWNVGVRTGKDPAMWIYLGGGEFVIKCQVERVIPK